ncbi:MAG: hypothetical protein CMM76_17500 [Rhodospirillaceae bacterium]|nr:hypothetical protein [Rhodospirillaceae bacterium]|tara:strand:+ start:3391 stop:3942 length:552 start_codon:yes stop_codon:yes gene_type:complete
MYSRLTRMALFTLCGLLFACQSAWKVKATNSADYKKITLTKGSKKKPMRSKGYPVYYTAELQSIASSGGSASTVVNFNDSGVIRSIGFQAIKSDGSSMDACNFTLNIRRQNQKGLVTQATLASIMTEATNGSSGGGPAATLPPMFGEFRVRDLDQLVIEVVNKNTTDTASLVHVTFKLHADGQ